MNTFVRKPDAGAAIRTAKKAEDQSIVDSLNSIRDSVHTQTDGKATLSADDKAHNKKVAEKVSKLAKAEKDAFDAMVADPTDTESVQAYVTAKAAREKAEKERINPSSVVVYPAKETINAAWEDMLDVFTDRYDGEDGAKIRIIANAVSQELWKLAGK